MKVYLCGPMSKMPDLNAPAFREAARSLRANGHEVVSPIELDEAEGTLVEVPVGSPEWQRFLKRDITAMLTCEAICPLDNWERSRGASLEMGVAEQLGLLRVDSSGHPTPRESALQVAQRIIHGARNDTYGPPSVDMCRTGRMIAPILPPCHQCGATHKDLPPDKVAMILICVKLSRLCQTPRHYDSIVDIAGYAGTIEMMG